MNQELALKLQAFLDGQLPEREVRQVESRLASDLEAAGLMGELRWTKTVLTANPPEMVLPEDRDFYWSKIQRDILRGERAAAAQAGALRFSWLDWKRWLAPVSGAVLAFLVVFGVYRSFELNSAGVHTRVLAQVESPSEEMAAFSFRSQSENVFVIWLYERSAEMRPGSSLIHDMIIQ